MVAAPEEPPSLESLKERIAASRGEESAKKTPRALRGEHSYGYIADLMAGFLVGTGLGYVLDREFHTLPIFTVFGLVLGSTGGIMLIYRASQRDAMVSGDEQADKNKR